MHPSLKIETEVDQVDPETECLTAFAGTMALVLYYNYFFYHSTQQAETTGKTSTGSQRSPEFQPSRRRVRLRVKRKMTECWTAKW